MILLICVTGGLCFSAGEGMRLTPLPVSAQAAAAAAAGQTEVAESRGASLRRHGPLDKPSQSQAQKRGKRQTLDCDRPPSQSFRKPPPDPLHGPGVRPAEASTPTRAVERPAGRAPPHAAQPHGPNSQTPF